MKLMLCCGIALLASAAVAAPKLDPQFGSHAVVQRDRPLVVTGSASPGEPVAVRLADRQARVTAGPGGRFAATLAAISAGGPFVLTAESPSGRDASDDVLAGDVFLCSGQSNMELQQGHAQDSYNQAQASADDRLRLMTIAKVTALTPQARFAQAPSWVVADPTSVPQFSAACYYMVQDLRKRSDVPIGAIADSWGGSQINAWMGEIAQRAVGHGAQADMLRLYAQNPAAAARQAGGAWEAWWRQATGDAAGKEPWQPSAALDWQPVPKVDFWEKWGVPALTDYNGMVWFRRDVTLTPAQARQAAVLAIGPVDDMDQTWVNGIPAGAGGNPGTPREYPLARGTLHAGVNVIVVNANDVYANGGMPGPAELMKLTLADGTILPLGNGWRYAVESRHLSNPPRVPWDDIAGAGPIYNGMIAPLGRLSLKGVAWYQGESDVGIPGYADRMVAMMTDWRRQFGIPDLPFVIVQLANYGTPAVRPGQSGWAELREQQRLATTRDRHAALALAIDIGDPLDIHPGEKHELGRRLGRAMTALAYGDPASASGPQVVAGTRSANGGVEVRFTGVTGSLHARSSTAAIGFELCGASEDSCRYAIGTPSGDRVLVAGDGQPFSRIRYAWSDSPTVNLFDEAPLPAGPFEIPVP